MAPLILLVATDLTARRRIDHLLSDAGYLVAASSSFQHAKQLLDSVSPDLVIADVRLDAFNGLHLAVRCRVNHPLVPVIITHDSADALLEAEASRLGASFIVDPLNDPAFLPRVRDALHNYRQRQQPIRRWRRKQVEKVIEAELGAAAARVCDVSYGGLRLALGTEPPLADVFDVRVPDAGVTVKARSVWKFRSPTTDEFWCGVELVDTDVPGMSVWREFVDGA
jgi:DNA-binding response OmpR family regulator